jgi:hypothetical protein
VRPTQLEDAGRIDVDAQSLGVEVGREQGVDDVLDEVRAQLLLEIDAAGVLRRDEHGVDADGNAVLVHHRDLRLAIWSQIRHGSGPAHLGQSLRQSVREPDGQGHQVGRLVAGVPEHHSLVARTLRVQRVLAATPRPKFECGVDSLRDVRRLRVE